MQTSQDGSSTSAQALDPRWVGKIFQELQGNYGTRFLNQWKTGQTLPDGSDAGVVNAMAMWGKKLAGFADQPERIRRVLDALPADPPSLPQFIDLCRQSTRKEQPALPYKPTAEDIERSRELAAQAKAAVKRQDFDGLLWAKRPRSQKAMDMVAYAKANPRRFPEQAAIFDKLVKDGVCNADGKLLYRWNCLGWEKVAA